MGKIFQNIDQKLSSWISQQKMFFVSTAPLSGEGLINCSPKGLDSLRILNENEVAYLDLTGSGVETISHLKENRRITLMFCALEGPPRILRLYGKGEVFEKGSAEYESLKSQFPTYTGARSIIKVRLSRIADSCGFGVPLYQFQEERDALLKWSDNKGAEGVAEYIEANNKKSLDGLSGLD